MCGRLLTKGLPSYDIHIEVISTFDPDDFDSPGDGGAEDLDALLDALTGVGEEEMNDQVYREFMFRICRSCQTQYIRAPLPRSLYRRRGSPEDGKPHESTNPAEECPGMAQTGENSAISTGWKDKGTDGRGRGKVIQFPGASSADRSGEE